MCIMYSYICALCIDISYMCAFCIDIYTECVLCIHIYTELVLCIDICVIHINTTLDKWYHHRFYCHFPGLPGLAGFPPGFFAPNMDTHLTNSTNMFIKGQSYAVIY